MKSIDVKVQVADFTQIFKGGEGGGGKKGGKTPATGRARGGNAGAARGGNAGGARQMARATPRSVMETRRARTLPRAR